MVWYGMVQLSWLRHRAFACGGNASVALLLFPSSYSVVGVKEGTAHETDEEPGNAGDYEAILGVVPVRLLPEEGLRVEPEHREEQREQELALHALLTPTGREVPHQTQGEKDGDVREPPGQPAGLPRPSPQPGLARVPDREIPLPRLPVRRLPVPPNPVRRLLVPNRLKNSGDIRPYLPHLLEGVLPQPLRLLQLRLVHLEPLLELVGLPPEHPGVLAHAFYLSPQFAS
mmetsp:Transcript_1934/g.5258  ORF Transcript_1934/g.5258 Transcript_1934/m.5258 type:complete len:229 (+) Transcript_1934:41-727(+)